MIDYDYLHPKPITVNHKVWGFVFKTFLCRKKAQRDAEKREDKARSYAVGFTKDGKITGVPKGFFATYMMDVFKIAMRA